MTTPSVFGSQKAFDSKCSPVLLFSDIVQLTINLKLADSSLNLPSIDEFIESTASKNAGDFADRRDLWKRGKGGRSNNNNNDVMIDND